MKFLVVVILVLECDINVLRIATYNIETGKASLDAFRSLQFSEIFFSDISQLSNKPSDVLQKIQVEVGTKTKEMVTYINDQRLDIMRMT